MPAAATQPTPSRARRLALPRLPLGRPVAWAIGLLFGLQSWLYYGTTAWLANVYVERGWSAVAAAGLLTLVNLASLGAIVVVPWLSRRGASRRTLLAASAVLAMAGLGGVTLVPGPAVAWAVIEGLGLGMTFTLVLTLPVDISDNPVETGGAAALMLLVGYLIASAAPFVLGAVRDATGNFEASLWLLVGIAAVMVPFAWGLSPERLRPPSSVAAG
jgi:CP family cyanate transporter-like MFS transporter